MDVAIDVLEYLDEHSDIHVENTGWKQGFGLEVAGWIPIRTGNLVVGLQTDGEELQIHRACGPVNEFEALLDLVCRFLRQSDA